jgi:hypothetical protein
MSDTPETDAAILSSGSQWNYVLRECARRLERERDEARAGRQAYKQLAVKHAQERDEARSEMNRYKRQWEESRSENVENAK